MNNTNNFAILLTGAKQYKVKEGDKINIRVIGQRFELNDKFVSIIGQLVREQKPKLVIEG